MTRPRTLWLAWLACAAVVPAGAAAVPQSGIVTGTPTSLTASRGLAIVPSSLDQGGAPAAPRAYARLKLRLPLYLGDPAVTLAAFDTHGLPAGILFNAAGREVARSECNPPSPAPLSAAIERLVASCSRGSCS